jgi:helicase
MNTLPLSSIPGPPISTISWNELGLDPGWSAAIQSLLPNSPPTDVQRKALTEFDILRSRRNLLVSAPTNSGKSLVGWLALIAGLKRGERVILIEPYRALAQEQIAALSEAMPKFSAILGDLPEVILTTGDVRLEDADFSAPPPENGQLVVATPERLAAILQNPDAGSWMASIGTIVVDESHLLSDPKRGPTLEWLLTWFRNRAAGAPRYVLMSGTVGNADQVLRWLEPCDLLVSTERQSSLNRSILVAESGDDIDELIVSWVKQSLAQFAQCSALVFVYQTKSAVKLAERLTERLGPNLGPAGALAYHAKYSAQKRMSVRALYQSGQSRCLVCTTALSAGVNLPSTHVLVRDLVFPGEGALPIDQLQQMAGRAGRRNIGGYASFLVKTTDQRSAGQLSEELENPKYRDLQSALSLKPRAGDGEPAVAAVNGFLAKFAADGIELEALRQFWAGSLIGPEGARVATAALRWLSDGARLLAFEEGGRVSSTRLGQVTAKSAVPPAIAAGIGQFVRDLLHLDERGQSLASWSALDSLILVELLAPTTFNLRRYSQELKGSVATWMENSPTKSVLFREWLKGDSACEVLNSLGIARENMSEKQDSEFALLAVQRAIVLWELSGGLRSEDLERRWQLTNLAGIEERWRDERLWLLGGVAEIFEIRCFFFCLKAELHASEDRILRTKRYLQRMRFLTYEVLGRLKYCSPVGGFITQAKRSGAKLGIGPVTLGKIDSLGIVSVAELLKTPDDTFQKAGIPNRMISQLRSYMRRRLR